MSLEGTIEKLLLINDVSKSLKGKVPTFSGHKLHKKSLTEQVDDLTKGRKPVPIGTKSKDGKTIKTAQGWEYIKEPGAKRGRKKGSKSEPKVEHPEGTPRGDAERETKKQFEDQDEYEFARETTVGNKGEDLLGSARHKRNEWKNLEDAESQGAAEALITRDKLLKNEPINLFNAVEINPTGAILGYYMMQKFPKAPVTKDIDEGKTYYRYRRGVQTFVHDVDHIDRMGGSDEILKKMSGKEYKREIRQQYYDAYKELSQKVAMVAEQNKSTEAMYSLVKGEVREKISELRRSNYYNQLANQFAKYNNNVLKTYGRLTNRSVAGSLQEFNLAVDKKHRTKAIEETGDLKMPTSEEMTEYAKQVLEGKDLREIFGIEKDPKGPKGFSAVEQYVDVAVRKGPPTYIKSRDRQENFILKKAQMRGLQWGNSVTDEERDHHLQHIADSFKDLTDILGLPEEMGSFNGKLGLAIGARGKGTALAYYERGMKVINLTRKRGVGSLAHEWGHFFDNILADISQDKIGSYASEVVNGRKDYLVLNEKRIWAKKDKSEEHQKIGSVLDDLRSEMRTWTREKLIPSKDFGGLSQGKRKYWSSTIEVFARSFERYVQHKLHKNDRENTYLTGVTPHVFWPDDEAIKKMEPHFDKLFETFKNSSYLKKALTLTQEVDELVKGEVVEKKSGRLSGCNY